KSQRFSYFPPPNEEVCDAASSNNGALLQPLENGRVRLNSLARVSAGMRDAGVALANALPGYGERGVEIAIVIDVDLTADLKQGIVWQGDCGEVDTLMCNSV